ncbi:short chain dehydrogenase [Lutimonas zeaxanthinifaciens]|uniref:short chain dehydrogenase n=1 Tax=Lutimonas zeaxanthinifaciens TaxID=3060215 RepID=UPI00265CB4F7|nr:short chain dehydrogenase [Lutimonas sp. YSD2104]WKK66045.1 short chain dehydrogenase [Lutimonas sp. YSD2104]
MKILIIGGNGTIGTRLVEHFEERHEVLVAGRNNGDFLLDLTDIESIKEVLESIPSLDSIICVAGEAKWDDFKDLSEEDFYIGIKSKLMGQVNLVRIAQHYLRSKGSITLTTGILADDPVIKTSSAAMVNGALHSFVKAVALEIENELRINVVASGVVQDAYVKYKDFFPGHNPVPMYKVVNAYARSLEGKGNGEIIRVYE